MTFITLHETPSKLVNNQQIYLVIIRACEIEPIQPLISYHCFLYVLELILGNQLHVTCVEVEHYTTVLLDHIEEMKKSIDEDILSILKDLGKLFTIFTNFAYLVVNKCFEEMAKYEAGRNNGTLVDQLGAAITFISVLKSMAIEMTENHDWLLYCGSENAMKSDFMIGIAKKSKALKLCLRKVLKDRVKLNVKCEDLLLQELESLRLEQPANNNSVKFAGNETMYNNVATTDIIHFKKIPDDGTNSVNVSSGLGCDMVTNDANNYMYSTNDASCTSKNNSSTRVEASISNQGPVPHFNSTGNLLIPQDTKTLKPSLMDISTRSEKIDVIQKRAKFAISALNYDDVVTAEKELDLALELLRLLNNQ